MNATALTAFFGGVLSLLRCCLFFFLFFQRSEESSVSAGWQAVAAGFRLPLPFFSLFFFFYRVRNMPRAAQSFVSPLPPPLFPKKEGKDVGKRPPSSHFTPPLSLSLFFFENRCWRQRHDLFSLSSLSLFSSKGRRVRILNRSPARPFSNFSFLFSLSFFSDKMKKWKENPARGSGIHPLLPSLLFFFFPLLFFFFPPQKNKIGA